MSTTPSQENTPRGEAETLVSTEHFEHLLDLGTIQDKVKEIFEKMELPKKAMLFLFDCHQELGKFWSKFSDFLSSLGEGDAKPNPAKIKELRADFAHVQTLRAKAQVVDGLTAAVSSKLSSLNLNVIQFSDKFDGLLTSLQTETITHERADELRQSVRGFTFVSLSDDEPTETGKQ